MKVKELIEKLEKFDKEKEAIIIFASKDDIACILEIGEIKEDKGNIGIFPKFGIEGNPNFIKIRRMKMICGDKE